MFLLYISLEKKKVVIVGGGGIVFRRLKMVFFEGVDIMFVSLDVELEIKQMVENCCIRWVCCMIEKEDYFDVFLIIVVMDNVVVNKEIV